MKKVIKVYKLFEDYRDFPWEWYGGVPISGDPHSYLCRILHPFAKEPEKSFLKGSPTLGEMKKFIDAYVEAGGHISEIITNPIYRFCSSESSSYKRKQDKILDFLYSQKYFVDDFKKKVYYLHATKRIVLPEDMVYYEKE